MSPCLLLRLSLRLWFVGDFMLRLRVVSLLLVVCALLAAVWTMPAQAKCAYQGVWLWPGADVLLPPNGIILLTGHQSDQAQLEKIADLKPALVSESGDRVALEVVEVRSGAANQSQVMLRPERLLSPSEHYSITFKEPPPAHWSDLSDTKWAVSGTPDTTPPVWTASPVADGGEVVEYGCGPGVNAHVKLQVSDSDAARPFLMDVTLTNEAGATERMWVKLPAQADTLSLGHGMCGGEFSMSAAQYQATFAAVDLAGNVSPAPGDALAIASP
jgi:hypothetical protein